MNQKELFEQVKKMIQKKDLSAAQKLIEENKDQLGKYFDQAKKLLDDAGGFDGIIKKVKDLFNEK